MFEGQAGLEARAELPTRTVAVAFGTQLAVRGPTDQRCEFRQQLQCLLHRSGAHHCVAQHSVVGQGQTCPGAQAEQRIPIACGEAGVEKELLFRRKAVGGIFLGDLWDRKNPQVASGLYADSKQPKPAAARLGFIRTGLPVWTLIMLMLGCLVPLAVGVSVAWGTIW